MHARTSTHPHPPTPTHTHPPNNPQATQGLLVRWRRVAHSTEANDCRLEGGPYPVPEGWSCLEPIRCTASWTHESQAQSDGCNGGKDEAWGKLIGHGGGGGGHRSTTAPDTHLLVCICSNVRQFSMIFVFFTTSPYVLVDRLCVLVAAVFSTTTGLHLNFTGQLLSTRLTLHSGWHSITHKSVRRLIRYRRGGWSVRGKI